MSKVLLVLEDIQYAIGPRTLLNIDRFEVRDGDRIGLVGVNGAGKTTLLKLIAGEIYPDSGSIQRFSEVALIRQMDADNEAPEFDGQLASEFAAQAQREGLSGGERTRRRIAGALSANTPLLLADEPTSDLDAQGVALLQKRLLAHRGALMLISHDRALLDALCTQIVELEDAKLTSYAGNYADYRREKLNRRQYQQFEYEQYRGEQARLRASMQRRSEQSNQVLKTPKRMGNSEARLHKRSSTEVEQKLNQQKSALMTRLNQLEEKQRPKDDPGIKMQLGASVQITSRLALEAHALTIRFGAKALLLDAEFRLPVGARTALLGENGCGKTTLIRRIVAGDPRIRLSPGVKIGLFGQDHADSLDLAKTSLENAMEGAVCPEKDVRTVMARLNLRGDDVFKPISVLSGGERAKVALAKLFVSDVNLLILDEPTNHLDVFTLEALETVLSEYAGTLLFVSHDKRFVEAIATRMLFFENRKLVAFEGTMGEYSARTNASMEDQNAKYDRIAMEMRMAFLASRIPNAKRDEKRKLEAEYQALVDAIRSQGGKTG